MKKANKNPKVPNPKKIKTKAVHGNTIIKKTDEDVFVEESPRLSFPVVGIGASAGGLDAFTSLLQCLLKDTGMAFVLIQHLSPTHKSILSHLLKKRTVLPVVEVTDGMAVVPNHVYVIPPKTCMSICDGHLRLQDRSSQDLPIDFFLTSLAEHQKNKAIAVILSGTASDGSQGIRMIKDHGGITFAQDEGTAKFATMPKNAIATGCIDFILSPPDIAKELSHLSHHPYLHGETKAEEIIAEESSFNQILILLQKSSGIDFKNYKVPTLKRRILRRMMLNKIETSKEYVTYLSQEPKEIEVLTRDVFITVTRFFRDPEVFEALKQDVFPQIIENHSSEPIRIWALGCSTGEEVYSLAISLLEFLEGQGSYRVQLFATDIKDPSIVHARQGIYSEEIAEDVSAERLHKFFIKIPKGYQIIKSIREMCVFARQNVVSDPPFSKLDLISCRNLLIYLDAHAQKRIMSLFHFALNSKGFLLLGQAESVGSFSTLFNVINKRAKIYSKNAAQRTMPLILSRGHSPSSDFSGIQKFPTQLHFSPGDIQKEADRIVLKRQHHCGVVVNEAMEVIQFRGDTSRYLKHVAGTASLSLLKMAQESLFLELRNGLQKVMSKNTPYKTKNIRVKDNGGYIYVSLEIIPFKIQTQSDRYFLIVFEGSEDESLSKPVRKTKNAGALNYNSRVQVLERELESTTLHLQGTIDAKEVANEELHAANEEILSTNEELQSLNEEFQSANEELESAKEELQATNEEITTLNDELQRRNIDLSELNDDHINLMNSISLPVIMLTLDLEIRSFTPAAEKVLRILPSDVGRFMRDLNLDVDVSLLETLVLKVINTGLLKELEAQDGKGFWYKIQIRPYRTGRNKIAGAVIAFVDVSELKQIQTKIQAYAEYREAIVQTIHNPLVVLDDQLRIKFANHSFYTSFNLSVQETMNEFIYNLQDGQWDVPMLRSLFEEILPKHKIIADYEITQDCPGIEHPRTVLVNARKIRSVDRDEELILLTLEDITERKKSEEQLRKFTEELKRSNTDLEQFAQIASHDIQEPLNVVNSYVQLLQRKIQPEPDQSKDNFIEIIGKEIKYIQSLVGGLLAYARIDSTKKIFEQIDCNECLESALIILQILIKEADAQVISDRLPVISGDKIQITRLFQNLISNAIKFKGNGAPRIRIQVQQKHRTWKISIKDNGIGIAPENFDKIFGIFSRLDKSYPGSGIGLSECNKIAERHGGKISVESIRGEGSIFCITFPQV